MYRTLKYRLYPSPEQAIVLAEYCRVVRFVYNLALEQRRDFWRQYRRATGRPLNYVSQGRQITELRRQEDWIAAVPACLQHSVLHDLDKAFAAFFRGGGFPRFRKMGLHEGFEIKAALANVRGLNRKWTAVKVPKLGWVKFRNTRAITGTIRSIRVKLDQGKWFACIGVESDFEAPASDLPPVGVDRGVTIALALSDGATFNAPPDLAALNTEADRARRALARRKRGSARYRAQRLRLAAVVSKTARVRRDWQHKATSAIARRYGTVILEALETRNMTTRGRERGVAQKRGLNRSILNIGWYSIELMLAYKLEERGGTLIKINPAYTSQTCSACGVIDKQSRESQARFSCTSCGHTMNADHNAAINILRQGMPSVDGGGCAPVEARTIQPRLLA